MAFKDKDELLDALWDHIFGDTDEDDITDDDEETFDHISKFFDQFDDNKSSGRRTRGKSSRRVARPKRGGRTRSSGNYGASLFFGKGKD